MQGEYAFTGGAAAVAPNEYNRSEATTQTREAYGDGMSECGNCHAGIHKGTGEGAAHPAEVKLSAAVIDNYNQYVKRGDLSRVGNNSYSSLVPFEEGTADYSALREHAKSDDSALSGPDNRSEVGCLSCHRAHASGFAGVLRSEGQSEFLTVVDASGNAMYADPMISPKVARGRAAVETQQAYYGRAASGFAAYQRSLCSNCHARD